MRRLDRPAPALRTGTRSAGYDAGVIPREHGAYAQLAAPLAVALCSARPTPAAWCLAAAAVLAFLTHEPLLVALGHRGSRARASSPRAALAVVAIGACAAIAGGVGIALGSPVVRVAVAIAAVPACALVVLAWRRAERSAAAETVAAIALSGASFPIAIAEAVPIRQAAIAWAC